MSRSSGRAPVLLPCRASERESFSGLPERRAKRRAKRRPIQERGLQKVVGFDAFCRPRS